MSKAEPGPDSATRRRAVEDLWQRTLSQVSTTFGRIVYLSSLRDANTGMYQHFGLAQIYSSEEADQALRSSHSKAFSEWLNYPLQDQMSDLQEYLRSLEGEPEIVLKTWAALSPYRTLLPTDASAAERQLFVSDLELILDLLRTGSSPSSRNRDA